MSAIRSDPCEDEDLLLLASLRGESPRASTKPTSQQSKVQPNPPTSAQRYGTVTNLSSASSAPPDFAIEQLSGLRCKLPWTLSKDDVKLRTKGAKFYKLSQLNSIHKEALSSTDPLNAWCTIGVLVSRMRRENTRGPYAIWKLSDLSSEEDMTLLVSKQALSENVAVMEGSLVLVYGARLLAPRDSKDTRRSYTVEISYQVKRIGTASDFAICSSTTHAGHRCTKAVNKSRGAFCKMHIGKEMKSIMPRFEGAGKKVGDATNIQTRPAQPVVLTGQRQTDTNPFAKKRPLPTLAPSTSRGSLPYNLGASLLCRGELGANFVVVPRPPVTSAVKPPIFVRYNMSGELKEYTPKPSWNKPSSEQGAPPVDVLGDLLNGSRAKADAAKASTSHESAGGRVIVIGEGGIAVTQKMDGSVPVPEESPLFSQVKRPVYQQHVSLALQMRQDAEQRHEQILANQKHYAAVMQQKRENSILGLPECANDRSMGPLPKKMKTGVYSSSGTTYGGAGTSFLAARVNNMTAEQRNSLETAVSRYAKQVEDEQHDKVNAVLSRLEKRDDVMTQMEEITSIKVKGHFCHECKIWRERIPDPCRERGHRMTSSMVTKRWFVCACKNRTTSLHSIRPTEKCLKCDRHEWTPCGSYKGYTGEGKDGSKVVALSDWTDKKHQNFA